MLHQCESREGEWLDEQEANIEAAVRIAGIKSKDISGPVHSD